MPFRSVGLRTFLFYGLCFLGLWISDLQSFVMGCQVPNVAELDSSHRALQLIAKRVEGSFKIYRAEVPLPRDVTESDSNFVLKFRGYLWRLDEVARANYTAKLQVGELEQSAAWDAKYIYGFSKGGVPNSSMLKVLERGTSQAIAATPFYDNYLIGPIDSLWFAGGQPVINFFQRPGTQLKLNAGSDYPDSLLMSIDVPDQKTEFILSPTEPFQMVSSTAASTLGDTKIATQVTSRQLGTGIVPEKILRTVTNGEIGYTELLLFDLKPLSDDAKIHSGLDEAVFKDMNETYQVYKYEVGSPKEKVGELFQKPLDFTPPTTSFFRASFLWINGILIASFILFLVFRYFKSKA